MALPFDFSFAYCLQLVQADGRCLEVYDCQNYWPFMLSVSACGPGNAQPDRCNITASQQWRFSPYNHSHSSGRFVSNITGCWPGSGGESSDANCCASVEVREARGLYQHHKSALSISLAGLTIAY